MTNEPGATTAPHSDRSVEVGPQPVPDTTPVRAPAAALLALLALAWLAAMLWSARSEIEAAGASVIAIALAANALPVVVSAALVAGTAAALAVANLLTHRGVVRATPRFLATTATGLTLGVLSALVVALSFPAGSARMVLAGTTAAAAVIGGALAGVRVPPAVGALVCATLAVFVVVLALSRFNGPLLSLFGAGDTEASKFDAGHWVSRLASFGAGLTAGLAAFGYLHRAQRPTAEPESARPTLRWPVYLVAGAGAGLMLLVTEVIIRIGGGSVLDLAGALSEADSVMQRVLTGSRIDHAITVLFVGALTTLIAFGRTLGPGPDAEPDSVEEVPEAEVSQ